MKKVITYGLIWLILIASIVFAVWLGITTDFSPAGDCTKELELNNRLIAAGVILPHIWIPIAFNFKKFITGKWE